MFSLPFVSLYHCIIVSLNTLYIKFPTCQEVQRNIKIKAHLQEVGPYRFTICYEFLQPLSGVFSGRVLAGDATEGPGPAVAETGYDHRVVIGEHAARGVT